MKNHKKTPAGILGVLLVSALLFDSCEEMFVGGLTTGAQKKPEEPAVADNPSEQEEDVSVTYEGNNIPVTGTTIMMEDGWEAREGLKPFNEAVFNYHRAAWKADHPRWYWLHQEHIGRVVEGGLHRFNNSVTNDIPKFAGVLGADWEIYIPWEVSDPDPLRFATISELYEKIGALWTEQRDKGASFLIQYDNERHYPKNIQIKNINDSGYDYTVIIEVYYKEDDTITFEV